MCFFKQKTAYELRISDWSSDVCSSDLYTGFWEQFGQVIKEGTGEDPGNQERIAKLLRFASTHNESAAQTVSLADYVSRMKEGQDKIYYVSEIGRASCRERVCQYV